MNILNWLLFRAATTRRTVAFAALAAVVLGADLDAWARHCWDEGASRPNLLANGGFETDANADGIPDGWNAPSPAVRTTALSHRDAASLLITGPAVLKITQQASLEPWAQHAISAHIRTQGVTGTGVSLRYVQTEPSEITYATPYVVNGSSWAIPARTFDAAFNHRTGRIELDVDITGGQIWIDDVALCRGGTNCDKPFVASYSVAYYAKGVSRSGPFTFTFSEPIPFSAIAAGFALNKNTIGAGGANASIGQVQGALSPSGISKTFTFTPDHPLEGLQTYDLEFKPSIIDQDGQTHDTENLLCFETAMDKTEPNTFTVNGAEVTLPANALPTDGRLDVSTTVASAAYAAATRKLQEQANDPLRAPVPGTAVDLTLYDDAGAPMDGLLNIPATVTLPYPDVDDNGLVDGTNPPIKVATLAVYVLDERRHLWERLLGSTIDTSSKTVSAPAPHFSVFALIGQMDTDLSAAYAFPVPFRASQGHNAVTFTGLGQGTRIKIYTAAGDLVRDVAVPHSLSVYEWNVANDDGVAVGSGVYYYRLESGANTKKGKLVIVR